MKKHLLLIVGTLAILSFAGCKDKHNPFKAAAEVTKERDLQRTFQSECLLKPVDMLITGLFTAGQANIKSNRVLYRFEGNHVTRTTQMFSTPDCADEAVAFIETGVFEINKDITSSDGGKGIDLKFDKLMLKVSSSGGATIANALKICGAADWSEGQERNVTSQSDQLTCYGAKVPRLDSNLYRVDAGNLILGSSNKDTQSQAQRPTELDLSTLYSGK